MTITAGANRTRRHRAQKGDGRYAKKRLCSRILHYGSEENKREIKGLLKEASKQVLSNYFEDHLKKPATALLARSAKMAYPSVNVYFGRNCGEPTDGVVERFAYATGTGTSTIGLDPHTIRFNPFLDVFDQILDRLPGVSSSDYNAVSGKIYYPLKNGVTTTRIKDTKLHVDVIYKSKDVPAADNSQVPGTPVLILTFGGEKLLYFCHGRSTQNTEKQTEFSFLQNDSHGFYLDGADENPNDEGMRWFHRSTMHPDNRKGMVISFMFRQVRNKRRVNVNDGTLADPGPDDPLFSSVRNTYQNNSKYQSAMNEIDKKAQQLKTREIH